MIHAPRTLDDASAPDNGRRIALVATLMAICAGVGAAENGLRGSYYPLPNFVGTPVVRVDRTIEFDWGRNAPVPGFPADRFSVVWEGTLDPNKDGDYQFIARTDDGVRLWVDGVLLIDQWRLRSATNSTSRAVTLRRKGNHAIRLEYFENAGLAVAKLSWKTPDGVTEVIPQSRLSPAVGTTPPPTVGSGAGLAGAYFQGRTPAGTSLLRRTDARVDFEWGSGSPASAVPRDNFSARWDGWLEPQVSGALTLAARSDDGVRVWLDGVRIIDRWADRSAGTTTAAPVLAVAGERKRLRIEYYENRGQAVAKLLWQQPGVAQQVVPQSQLYPNLPPTAVGSGLEAVGGTAITGSVDASDADGDPLAYSVTAAPSLGTLTLDAATGAFTYIAPPAAQGSAGFAIAVSDGIHPPVVTDWTVAVTPANRPPVVTAPAADQATVYSETTMFGASVSDPDGDDVTVTVATSHGRISLAPTSVPLTWLDGDGDYETSTTFSGPAAAVAEALAVIRLQVSDVQFPTATITVSASDGEYVQAASTSADIVQPPGASEQPVAGPLVIEAEAFTQTIATTQQGWARIANAGASDGSAMQALRDDGWIRTSDYAGGASPVMRFRAWFARGGTYRVWLRAAAPDLTSDSVHLGLDGAAQFGGEAASGIPIDPTLATWAWASTRMAGGAPTLDIPGPGLHWVEVWVRENGVAIDQIALSDDPEWSPSGNAPLTASPRGATLLLPPTDPYAADGDGRITIEAELTHERTAASGHAWTPVVPMTGAFGHGALVAGPDEGTVFDGWAIHWTSPRATYRIDFPHAGTWTLWLRGAAPDSDGDMVHVGLDGVMQETGWWNGWLPSSTGLSLWTWTSWNGWSTADLTVPTAGVHTVDLWQADDGAAIDVLQLVPVGAMPSPNPVPSSTLPVAGAGDG